MAKRPKTKTKTPIMTPDEARFMALEGLVQWTQAVITQSARVSEADARQSPSLHLSCSPFQVAGTRMRSSRASGSEWPRLSRAGGTIIKTTVDHALMRGLDTAGPVMRRGASSV